MTPSFFKTWGDIGQMGIREDEEKFLAQPVGEGRRKWVDPQKKQDKNEILKMKKTIHKKLN